MEGRDNGGRDRKLERMGGENRERDRKRERKRGRMGEREWVHVELN